MSDNELRDKLASEYADNIRSSESGTAQDGFIAGWDAARANPIPVGAIIDVDQDALIAERDQLRAEVERLNEVIRDVRQLEGKALAQCEKLAQALDDILMAVPSLSAVLKIARENLAEYRKSKGE